MNFSIYAIVIGLPVLFTLVIVFGLRTRKKMFAKSLELKAADLWPQIQDARFELSGLLYGVWQDFSSTRLGMIVKDCRDQEVGKIIYRVARREWILIECSEGNFAANSNATMRLSISLRAASTEAGGSLCEFTRLAGGGYRFDAKSLGILESRSPRGLYLAPVFQYTLNGTPAGAGRPIGRWFARGRMLVLPNQLPLAIRLFVLAMQGQRS